MRQTRLVHAHQPHIPLISVSSYTASLQPTPPSVCINYSARLSLHLCLTMRIAVRIRLHIIISPFVSSHLPLLSVDWGSVQCSRVIRLLIQTRQRGSMSQAVAPLQHSITNSPSWGFAPVSPITTRSFPSPNNHLAPPSQTIPFVSSFKILPCAYSGSNDPAGIYAPCV